MTNFPTNIDDVIVSGYNIAEPGLIAWISLNNTTTPTRDTSGNNFHATIVGYASTAGKSGNGFLLNGTTSYMTVPIPSATYSSLYFSAWFNLSSAASYCVFDPRNDAGVGGSPLFTDSVSYYVDGATTLSRVPYDGLWHHVVASLSNIVVNKAWIGRTYSGLNMLSGSVDEIRFYSSLTDNRKASLYTTPSTYEALSKYPATQGYSDTKKDNILRTQMSTGPAKVRLRSTVAERQIKAQYMLDYSQRQILDQYYDSLGGVNTFIWKTPDTDVSLVVRFGGPITYQTYGINYIASVTFEVMP